MKCRLKPTAYCPFPSHCGKPPGFPVSSVTPRGKLHGLRIQPVVPTSTQCPPGPLLSVPTPLVLTATPGESPSPCRAATAPRALSSHGDTGLPRHKQQEKTRSSSCPTLSPEPGLSPDHSQVFPAKVSGWFFQGPFPMGLDWGHILLPLSLQLCSKTLKRSTPRSRSHLPSEAKVLVCITCSDSPRMSGPQDHLAYALLSSLITQPRCRRGLCKVPTVIPWP